MEQESVQPIGNVEFNQVVGLMEVWFVNVKVQTQVSGKSVSILAAAVALIGIRKNEANRPEFSS